MFANGENTRGWHRAGSCRIGSDRQELQVPRVTRRAGAGEAELRQLRQQPEHSCFVESHAMSTLEFFMHFSPSTFWSMNKKGNIADYLETLSSAQGLISVASISHTVSFGIRNTTTRMQAYKPQPAHGHCYSHSLPYLHTHSFPTTVTQEFSFAMLSHCPYHHRGFLTCHSTESNSRSFPESWKSKARQQQ